MFHDTRFYTFEFASFFEAHTEALENAALLLGGPPAAMRTRKLMFDVRSQPKITNRMRRETLALHNLLTLQNVHDYCSDAAHHFTMLAPDSPHVAEICLLADGLENAMASEGIEPCWMTEEADEFVWLRLPEDWR